MIQGIEIRKLEKHVDERGFLCELLRKDWEIFDEFAMAYVSVAYPGVVKAWHRHNIRIDNLCTIGGMAKIVVYDERKNSPTNGVISEFIVGEDSMVLVKIPPGCWHGFKAIGTKPVVLINFPSILYDPENPDEDRLPPDTEKIAYDWKSAP